MPSYSREIDLPGRSASEIYSKVSEGIDRFMSKSPLGDYDIKRDEQAHSVSVKSSMFSAQLECKAEKVILNVKLGLLAAPFRGKLDEGINRWLEKAFGNSG